MSPSGAPEPARVQVNVPLAAHWHLVLKLLTVRDGRTAPEILRPVIETWLEGELAHDVDLASAVRAMAKSQLQSAHPPASDGAAVTPIAPSGRGHRNR